MSNVRSNGGHDRAASLVSKPRSTLRRRYSRGGKVVHTSTDHASIVKFIERNWHLQPLITRSRDNLPNPITAANNPYVPLNMPAIGDLFDMFDFDRGARGHEE